MKVKVRLRTALISATVAVPPFLTPMPAAAQTDEVDSNVRAQMQRQHIPGLSLAVVWNGEVVKAKGYGLANVELNVPATRDTVNQSGSIGKKFTAAAIMMLVEEGKIALADSLLIRQVGSDSPHYIDSKSISCSQAQDRSSFGYMSAVPALIFRLVAVATEYLIAVCRAAFSQDVPVEVAHIGKLAPLPCVVIPDMVNRQSVPDGLTATGTGRA